MGVGNDAAEGKTRLDCADEYNTGDACGFDQLADEDFADDLSPVLNEGEVKLVCQSCLLGLWANSCEKDSIFDMPSVVGGSWVSKNKLGELVS